VGSVSGIQDNKAYTLVPYASDNLEVSFTIAPGATPLADGDFFTLEVTESGLGYGRIVRDMVKASGSGDAAVLFAATATGVFKSTDGGQLWNEVSNFAGDNITTIAAHPDNPNTVYAGTLESGVYYATNAGSTNWMPVTTNGLGGGISATSPMADTNNIGTGIMSAVEVNGETNTQSENWTVVYNEGTALFEVTGSVSGTQADYNITTGVYTITDVLSFTISEGSVPFEDGDTFTFSTTRDPGTYIKDLLIYDGAAGENYLYAVTYFFGDLEPHAVGNVYGIDLRNAANNYVPAIGAVWEPVNTGLPQYDPPGDTTLFAQHVMALDNPASPGAMYIGGEGIHFYKATTDLATKNPQWFASESGLTNLIMSRMPILFTDDCTMSVSKDVKDLDGDGSIDDYRFKIYIEDNNGNPPIVGSNFTFVQKCGDEETTIANIDYPDAYVHQGTFRDIADPSTDIPYIYNFIDGAASGCEYKFSFTPTCGTGAPGCSGSNQELTLF
jgi:hypothetical protein